MSPGLRDAIKTAVLLEQGLKLSDEDPIFSYLIANQAVLDDFSRPIADAIAALPSALGESVHVLVAAVEECEGAATDLINKTQGEIRGIARVEVESAHLAVKEAVQDSVNQLLIRSLDTVKAELTDVERRAKAASTGLGGARSQLLTTSLAVSLAIVLAVSSVTCFALYRSVGEQQKAAAHWYEQAMKKSH